MKTFYLIVDLQIVFGAYIFGQEISDYYNRPIQEIQEKIWVQDTTLKHSGGFLQSYYGLKQWVNNIADSHLKSVVSYDSLGVTQLILHSDCQALRSTGPVFEYYMSLSSASNSIFIEFWNINPKLKDCDRLYRKSLVSEIIGVVRSFVDSTKYIHAPCLGYNSKNLTIRVANPKDSSIDSIFEFIKQDSLQHIKDSVAKIPIGVNPVVDVKVNLNLVDHIVDSLSVIVDADSITLHQYEISFFEKQISLVGKIDIDTRLECLDFFLSQKLRSSADMLKYLGLLQKYCSDKCDLIKTVRVTLPDEQKYKAAAAFHRSQNDYVRIQKFMWHLKD